MSLKCVCGTSRRVSPGLVRRLRGSSGVVGVRRFDLVAPLCHHEGVRRCINYVVAMADMKSTGVTSWKQSGMG